MSDIVERCRKNQCKENMGCNTNPNCSCADLEDAADTIEQLRAELAALREPDDLVGVKFGPLTLHQKGGICLLRHETGEVMEFTAECMASILASLWHGCKPAAWTNESQLNFTSSDDVGSVFPDNHDAPIPLYRHPPSAGVPVVEPRPAIPEGWKIQRKGKDISIKTGSGTSVLIYRVGGPDGPEDYPANLLYDLCEAMLAAQQDNINGN